MAGWMVLIIAAMLIACVLAAAAELRDRKSGVPAAAQFSRELAPLITAIGMSLLLQTLAMIIWKPNYQAVSRVCCPVTPYEIGGAVITPTQIC
jgi:branched-chain amino acid transport system permease protein